MSEERTRTRTREGAETTAVSDRTSDREITRGTAEDDAGVRGRFGRRAGRLFSPRAFAVATLLSVAGVLAADAVVPLPGAGLLGVFLAAFLVGLGADRRRYVELAAAGGVTAGASVLLDVATLAFLGGVGAPLVLLAGGVGAGVGALGAYFGRDLRDGLTRDI